MYDKGDVLLILGMSNCDPCKRINNVLLTSTFVGDAFKRGVRVVDEDIEDRPDLVQKYNPGPYPTILSLHDGIVKDRRAKGWGDTKDTEQGLRKLLSDFPAAIKGHSEAAPIETAKRRVVYEYEPVVVTCKSG